MQNLFKIGGIVVIFVAFLSFPVFAQETSDLEPVEVATPDTEPEEQETPILEPQEQALLAQETPTTMVEDTATSPPQTEAERIKQEILELYPSLDFGREVNEPEKPRWLFEDEKHIREALGLNPRFIYNPKDLPDPMVIPWIRHNVIAQELMSDALRYIKEGKLQLAEETLKRIVDAYSYSSVSRQAQTELEKLRQRLAEEGKKSADSQAVVLPSWIYENTRGIVWDEKKPVVLIGDYILEKGEAIPKYPEIIVDDIQQSKVVLKFKDIVFTINVEPY